MDLLNTFANDQSWVQCTRPAEDLTPKYELAMQEADLIEFEPWASVSLRLESSSTGHKIVFLFPDRVSELHRFFGWVRRGAPHIYTDLDQGWMVQAVRRGDRLHFRQPESWEDRREGVLISVDFQTFVSRLDGLEDRIAADAARLEGRG